MGQILKDKFEKHFSNKPWIVDKCLSSKIHEFKIGEIVVYPKHGVGEIISI